MSAHQIDWNSPERLFHPVMGAPSEVSFAVVDIHDRRVRAESRLGAMAKEIAYARQPLHARIKALAFRYAMARGFAPGRELDDWLAAERDVTEGRA